MTRRRSPLALPLLALVLSAPLAAQDGAQGKPPAAGEELIERSIARGMPPAAPAPDRKRGEGPFDRLVIRGATLIDVSRVLGDAAAVVAPGPSGLACAGTVPCP